jgi:hypothetical protein
MTDHPPELSPEFDRTLEPTSGSVSGYFHAVAGAYLRADQSAVGGGERYFRIGGYTIRVRALGETLLAEMTVALAHLATEVRAEADLTIHVWDSAVAPEGRPPSPLAWAGRQEGKASGGWRWDQDVLRGARIDARGELAAFNTGRIRTSFHVWPHMLRALDSTENVAFYWIDDARNLPYYERGAPFRKILSWWMIERDRLFLHAGAVGTHSGGVLLVGEAGAGKSTSALACMQSGMAYGGDDYCLVASGPAPHVYSLYNTAKLKGRDDLERFPHLAPLVENQELLEHEKALMFLNEHYPKRMATDFPLQAVLIPKVTGTARPRLVPVPPATGLRAMAPSTVQQLPGSGRSAVHGMADLVQRVPSYLLELGPDVAAIPALIRTLLAEG